MKPETLAALAVLVLVPVLVTRRRADLAGPAPDAGAAWVSWPQSENPQSPDWETWSLDPDTGYMQTSEGDDMPDQLPGVMQSAMSRALETLAGIPASVGLGSSPPPPGVALRNERAFLDLIAYAEGTAGPNGYRTLFGGGTFESFADHPRVFATFTNSRGEKLRTSAAGRYQFLSRTWDALAARLKLPNFGPESQDRAALELIRERGALADVRAGRVAAAVVKCAPVWASLPGAGYAQPERKLSSLVAAFNAAGGTLEA